MKEPPCRLSLTRHVLLEHEAISRYPRIACYQPIINISVPFSPERLAAETRLKRTVWTQSTPRLDCELNYINRRNLGHGDTG